MGQYSWNTSDTKRSIPLAGSTRETFIVYMLTSDQVYEEVAYNGHGNFGGKNFHVAVFEMNLFKFGLEKVIKMYNAANSGLFKSILTGTTIDELSYDNIRNIGIELESASRRKLFDVAMPKLVEDLKEALKKNISDIPNPTSCEYQGCAYPEDEEEDDGYL